MKKLSLFLLVPFTLCAAVDSVNPDTVDSDALVRLHGYLPDYRVIERDSATRYSQLTDSDFIFVASELGVEPAVLHAVVDIEAGSTHRGFASPGMPVINFDSSVFRSMLRKKRIPESGHKGSEAFSRVNIRKYGGYAQAQYARLNAAREIDRDLANEATFWGMFQIGGFNWRKCGARDIDEFVYQMSYSEEMQLELFARFIKSNGKMLAALKTKNWRRFAYLYNGPRYASHGYHTRLARAYKKYKNNN